MEEKLHAFFIHLVICGLIAGIAVLVVFFVWYPAPLHLAAGVTKIFLMLLAIDIVIGPVITFIIYKPNKPSLKFDLCVIALLQLCALTYGMYSVFVARPAFVVYNVDRFDIARAIDIDPASAKTASTSGNLTAEISWFKPKWVGAVASSNKQRRQEIMFSAAMGGSDWPLLPELYVPLTDVKQQMLTRAKTLEELRKLYVNKPGITGSLANWRDDAVKWLPMRGKAQNMVVIIDAKTAQVLATLEINPWP